MQVSPIIYLIFQLNKLVNMLINGVDAQQAVIKVIWEFLPLVLRPPQRDFFIKFYFTFLFIYF